MPVIFIFIPTLPFNLSCWMNRFIGYEVLNPRLYTHTHLTWTNSWPGSSEAAQHDVCDSRNDGDFSPAEQRKVISVHADEIIC